MRCFIAVPLPEILSKNIGQYQSSLKKKLSSSDMKISWTRLASIHLTLRFLGEIEADTVSEINRRLSHELPLCPATQIEVKGVGAFPNLQKPRIMWAGLKTNQQLHDLHSLIKEQLSKLPREADDKAFKPHLTLGRVRFDPTRGRAFIQATKDSLLHEFGALPVEEVRLYRSHLKQSGPEYEILSSWTLAKQ